MKRFAKPVQLLIFLAGSLLFPQLTHAQPVETPEKVVTIEGITEYRYKNGLRFLSYPDASSPTVTVNMTVLVGSRHEGYGETGMAHLLEHMLFQGCKLYPTSKRMDGAMQAHGAVDYNATTWTDRTNYYEELPGTDKNLDFALHLEADRLQTSFIRREDLVKEMKVVRDEFARGENSPANILTQRMYAVAFEWHNYGKSTIGNLADIERVPVESLHAFYKKYYRVDNVVLIVAGKFDEKKALEHVGKYFGPLKAPELPLANTYTEEPAQDGDRAVTLRRVGKVPVVGLLYHAPAAAHPENAACDILAMILADTPSGRLYKTLVEKKKAGSISYDATNWFDPGVLELTAKLSDNISPIEVRDLMINECEKFNDQPATQDEVTRAVRKYLAIREQRLTKSKTTAIELSDWAGAGDWRLLFIQRDRVAKVTPKDVDRVAGKYLKQSNRTVGMFIPTTEAQRTPIPETPDIAALVKDFKGGEAVVKGEVFDPTPENIEKRVKRFTLPGGLKVAFFPKKTRGDTVTGTMTLHFGNEKSLLGQSTPSAFLGSLMLKGTKQHNRQQIQDKLNILKSQLSVSSGLGSLNATWESKRDTHADLLKLLQEVLREPTFPDKELDILKQGRKQAIEQAMVDPQGLAFSTLTRKINPHPATSIHYVPSFQESLIRLAKLKLDDVVQLYHDQLGGTVGELAIVGDFDPDATQKQLEAIFADWKSKVPYERIPDVLVAVKGERETLNIPDKENAVYGAALRFAMDDTDPNYAGMEIGNHVLGSGFTSRLMERLRQKEGWSYGAGSRLSVGSQDKVSRFIMFATCDPQFIDKVDAGALEELAKFIKSGPTEAEVKLAKTAYLAEMKVELGKDGSLVSELRSGLHLGRTMTFQAELEKKIAAVTVADVNRAIAANLSVDRLVIIRAGDFSKKK